MILSNARLSPEQRDGRGSAFETIPSSAAPLALALCRPCLHQFLDKSRRHRLIVSKLDRPFRSGEVLKLLLKSFDDRCCRKQAAVLRKSAEPYQHPLVLERRNPIADGLGSLRWHSTPNRCTHLAEIRAGSFRDAGKIFVNVFGSNLGFRADTTPAGLHFFHAVLLS